MICLYNHKLIFLVNIFVLQERFYSMHDSKLTLRNQYVRVIEEKYVALTGNSNAAAILRHLTYWCENLKDKKEFEKENEHILNAAPDFNSIIFNHGWLYKSARELTDELFLSLSSRTILRFLNFFVNEGWLHRRRNPNNKIDRTWQYRINIPKIIFDLKKLGWNFDGTFVLNAAENPIGQNGECIGQFGESQQIVVKPKKDLTSPPIPQKTPLDKMANALDNLANANVSFGECIGHHGETIPKDTIQNNIEKNNYINIITKKENFGTDSLQISKTETEKKSQVAVNEKPTVRKSRAKSESTHLDENATLTPEWEALALKAEIHPDHWEDIFTKFYNHYTGGKGAALKMKKWERCWHNWCLRQIDFTNGRCRKPKPEDSVYERCVKKLSAIPPADPGTNLIQNIPRDTPNDGENWDTMIKNYTKILDDARDNARMGHRENV